MAEQRVGVIGGGIIGLAVARRLLQVRDGAAVTVLEKEDRVGVHQTGHNSGVVHAGLYYPPGSLKATLCRRGTDLLREYCGDRQIAFVECGKVVVALTPDEVARLDAIEERAQANGVPGLRRMDVAALREVEPHVSGLSALHSPRTAIVDFAEVARALADDVRAAGGAVHLRCEATGIAPAGEGLVVRTSRGDLAFDRLVVCAGLQSDRVARWAGDDVGPAIVPFRGEYRRLRRSAEHLVRGLVYPVPDPAYPFLGIHLTRRVGGGVDVGPNAVLATAREGYDRRDLDVADLRELLAWPGFRRLAAKHWPAGISEIRGSVSKRVFVAAAQRYVPALQVTDVVDAPAGVRAQAVDADGTLVDDFRIGQVGPVTTVRNAPSPAATSSLAIAEHLVDQVLARTP